ncbi:LysR family transcriptional regulator [Marinomonas posidonica]|uniref:Transcriptional regulator, LysR family n=1 Tax=Marinomonas posidonica (strain CECT 7376 / NCIMB 14433 / IVIA-Po-181) TaxID=491952 RepID=F6CTZ9_MARPP|nr:LysR family transcriptional regulator [Marinomonas posidonica]AEF54051.1 transcriptional regulator, LysR family [Marinomonas posidonica IVIA-Po-181]
MESKHLIYLATILDKGSITAAAEYLNLAQPTLTRAMATLEMQAGTQLFTRSRFGVTSTQVGESLAREGRAITRRLGAAQEQVSRYKLGIKQNLRIASGSLLAMGVLPKVIDRMIEEHPDVSLTITCLNPSVALEGLLDDQFDIVIAPQSSDRNTTSLYSERLKEDKIGIFCGQQHPLANRSDIQIDDFMSLDWLSLGIASYFEQQTTEMLSSYGIHGARTKAVFRNDAYMLMKMLASGRYLAALPHFPVTVIKEEFSICELKLEHIQPVSRDLYLWCVSPLQEQFAFQSFQKIAKEVFEEQNIG